jgi:hypothetical protein
MAKTVSKSHGLLLRFSYEKSSVRLHIPGFLRIGVSACFVWAFPPIFGGTAWHIQVHSRHMEYPTVADAVIETGRHMRANLRRTVV